MFKIILEVMPSEIGLLMKNNAYIKKCDPGIYTFWTFFDKYQMIKVPDTVYFAEVVNQEVMSKDKISFRFSFVYWYKVENPELLINVLGIKIAEQWYTLERQLTSLIQIEFRDRIAMLESEEVFANRSQLSGITEEAQSQILKRFGVLIQRCDIKDLTFPKHIQELFAKELETKIRAKADLENARTTVAAARALKNASEMMKDDDNIRFYQWMETLQKIASKGKHSFYFGDYTPKNSK